MQKNILIACLGLLVIFLAIMCSLYNAEARAMRSLLGFRARFDYRATNLRFFSEYGFVSWLISFDSREEFTNHPTERLSCTFHYGNYSCTF
jgi:hypothetical protein